MSTKNIFSLLQSFETLRRKNNLLKFKKLKFFILKKKRKKNSFDLVSRAHFTSIYKIEIVSVLMISRPKNRHYFTTINYHFNFFNDWY